MPELANWRLTPGDNSADPPLGFPEGMAASAVNNSARQMMSTVKGGAVIWFATVADMRAVTTIPEVGCRYALMRATAGTIVRFYQWLAAKTSADNGESIISPTGFSAGAFEEIGRAFSGMTGALAGQASALAGLSVVTRKPVGTLIAQASYLAGAVTDTP